MYSDLFLKDHSGCYMENGLWKARIEANKPVTGLLVQEKTSGLDWGFSGGDENTVWNVLLNRTDTVI